MPRNLIAWLTVYGLSSLICRIVDWDEGIVFMLIFTVGYIGSMWIHAKKVNGIIFSRYVVIASVFTILAYLSSIVFRVDLGIAYLILTIGVSLTSLNLWNNGKK